jgi:site-specific DNA recombinase
MALRKPRPKSTAASEPVRSPRRQAVSYARVSSKDQEREGFSIPSQQRLLQTYADQNGIDIVEQFVDVETAKKSGRTHYVEMLAYLRRNQRTCNLILVEKTDRLYRNLKDWVDLDAMDLEIHLVKEGTVLSNEARSSEKFMHGIRVLMAKNYIDNLVEETTKGMKEKAAQGIWPSKAPLGYVNVRREDGKKAIVPDPATFTAVKQLFEWASSGLYSLAEMQMMAHDAGLRMRKGTKLGVPTLHRILHNPIYKGEVHWHGAITRGVHEPMVTPELWDRVQEVLTGRYQHQRDGERADTFSFVGLVLCGHCECALSAVIKKEKYIYYHCTGQRGRCEEPYVREHVLAEQFGAALRGLRIDDVTMRLMNDALHKSHDDLVEFHQESITRLEADCARVQKRIDQAYLDKLDGVIDAGFFTTKSAEWRDELRGLRAQIQRHEVAHEVYVEEGLLLAELGNMAFNLFEGQSATDRRKLLNFLVGNSYWAAGTLRIEWRKPFDLLEEIAAEGPVTSAPSDGSEGASLRLVTPTGFEPVLPG